MTTVRVRGIRNSSPMDRLLFFGWEERADGCWNWLGRKSDKGYGIMGTSGSLAGRSQLAHRLMYEIQHNAIVESGISVMHSCDNRGCVNPDHLSVGTHAENMLDMAKKLRSRATKMNTQQVLEIRDRLAQGGSVSSTARLFGISSAATRKIRNRQTWAWLEEENVQNGK